MTTTTCKSPILNGDASDLSPLQPSMFEQSRPGAVGVNLPPVGIEETSLNTLLQGVPLRGDAPRLPEMAQLDVVRHFVKLSQLNHSIDSGFYPLGSCTMKYNPKVCDFYGMLPGLTQLHPLTPDADSQGSLRMVYTVQELLKDITGFDAVTLQPAAGAHGELVGIMMIKAYFAKTGELAERRQIIVPDSAHGTNPASAAMCGFEIVEIKSQTNGRVDLDALKAVLGPQTAGIMLTNPSTLGLFETDILEISRLVHDAGGLLYYDGANLNAIVGVARPADMGFDVMHINTHKTFATPHGGGGPGCGPVCVTSQLAPFLPTPNAAFDGTHYYWNTDLPDSIGRVKTFNGNFEMIARALTYLLAYGADGLKQVATDAVLNANYVRSQLLGTYEMAYNPEKTSLCMHEFVMNSHKQHAMNDGLNTMTLAKRLMDYGIHPMTVYFPLVAHEAMMIEPTETECKATLDHFIAVMKRIDEECRTTPDVVINAPHTMPIKKVDEVTAARKPALNFYCCG
ncbi:MAG: aminomethyl-transferring glycine dehydrogenase subunit GcvPB [Vampirovibrionales bacterium]